MFVEANFFPSLEVLSAHRSSITTCIRFEKLLFMEAQVRHTWEWWQISRKPKPATCFRPGLLPSGKTKVVCAGHPINSGSRRMHSWRAYHEIAAKKRKGEMTGESVVVGDWILV
ncbi:hypothetical protein FRC08_005350 [Ceratobasidium sp. 394]|nr:hypothetical protein FRC08_005350 [Ceratobasidium sp. 394]